MDKFKRTGSVLDDKVSMAAHKFTMRTEENVKRVKEHFTQGPSTSQRKASQVLGIPRSTLQRIMKEDLELFPYKIQVVQSLTPHSLTKRLEFANEVLQLIDTKQLDTKIIHFSDECHFDLNGYVNKQNYRHWGTEKPYLTIAKPLHPKRITVWCAVSAQRIIGPIFLDTTVTGPIYKAQILDKFIEQASQHRMVINYWFQQDGARPHRTQEVFDRLNEVFGTRIIGLDAPRKAGGGIEWSPYSPDLNVCDFFLWGYVKDRVYKNNPKNIEELKKNITDVIQDIKPEVLEHATNSFETRLRHLITINGGHFENLIH